MNEMNQIHQWHVAYRKAGLQRKFELGDLILRAVVRLDITVHEVAEIIIDNEKDLAMSNSWYRGAATIAKTFNKKQRKILIAKLVPIEKVEVLAEEHFTDRQRVAIISDIGSGKCKAPWGRIACLFNRVPSKPVDQPRGNGSHETTKPDSGKNPDVVTIAHHGEIDEEAILNVLKNLISRIGKQMAERLWEQAQRETR